MATAIFQRPRVDRGAAVVGFRASVGEGGTADIRCLSLNDGIPERLLQPLDCNRDYSPIFGGGQDSVKCRVSHYRRVMQHAPKGEPQGRVSVPQNRAVYFIGTISNVLAFMTKVAATSASKAGNFDKRSSCKAFFFASSSSRGTME